MLSLRCCASSQSKKALFNTFHVWWKKVSVQHRNTAHLFVSEWLADTGAHTLMHTYMLQLRALTSLRHVCVHTCKQKPRSTTSRTYMREVVHVVHTQTHTHTHTLTQLPPRALTEYTSDLGQRAPHLPKNRPAGSSVGSLCVRLVGTLLKRWR